MKDLAEAKVYRVTSHEDVTRFFQWLGERRDWLALDTETTGLNRGRDWVRLIQFADQDTGWAFDYRDWRGVAKQVLSEYKGNIVCHNLLYDSSMLKKDGLVIPQLQAHDTMIMCHLKDPAARMDLKGAAASYVDKRARIGRGLLEQVMSGGNFTWETVPIDHPAYWMYGTMDVILTSRLAAKLHPEIELKFRDAYELELGTIHCLRDAELAGILTDDLYIARASRKIQDRLAELRPKIPCDPNSDKRVVEYLTSIGVPLFVQTENGNLSTDKNVMAYFKDEYPVCGLISEYKSLDRMLGNYLRKFTDLAVDGVLRASTKPVGAFTGRMSVTDPPLQTLPRGRIVRDAIIARPGHRLLMADFAGMEMRALAADAQETAMLAAYNRGEDLHNFVARSLYGENFTKPQRSICKNAAFAKVYGAGIPQFATTAKIPIPEAQAFMEEYDRMFPGVKTYMENVVGAVMERAGGRRGTGWVTLIDGRVLPVRGDKAYVAVNYRIQGSTAVITKRKINELAAAGLGEYFRLAVHDELLFEVPEEEVPAAREVIRTVMPDRYSFKGVVLEIDQDEVNRWGQHYRHDFPKYVETEDPEWLAA